LISFSFAVLKRLTAAGVALGMSATLATSAATGDLRLIEAVKASDTAAMSRLVKQRALVNMTEADGSTALHWAARLDRADMVRALIRREEPLRHHAAGAGGGQRQRSGRRGAAEGGRRCQHQQSRW
jgi:hypothetical protein